jgi:hypothetical protein
MHFPEPFSSIKHYEVCHPGCFWSGLFGSAEVWKRQITQNKYLNERNLSIPTNEMFIYIMCYLYSCNEFTIYMFTFSFADLNFEDQITSCKQCPKLVLGGEFNEQGHVAVEPEVWCRAYLTMRACIEMLDDSQEKVDQLALLDDKHARIC